MRRRHLLQSLAAPAIGAVLAPLQGCAGLGGPPRITLSEAELAALVARAFPLQQRVLDVLDLQLSVPRLRLLPDSNRLAVALSLRAQERLRGGNVQGELAFDSGLRYAPQDATMRLSEVRVQHVVFASGGDGSLAASVIDTLIRPPGVAQRIGRVLAELLLEDLVVYRVGAERLAHLRQLGLQPGAVTVTGRGVEIALIGLDG